jgi:hypothetical protein
MIAHEQGGSARGKFSTRGGARVGKKRFSRFGRAKSRWGFLHTVHAGEAERLHSNLPVSVAHDLQPTRAHNRHTASLRHAERFPRQGRVLIIWTAATTEAWPALSAAAQVTGPETALG